MAEEVKKEETKEQAAPVQTKVTLEVTANGETKTVEVRFHTPTLAKKVAECPDGSTIKLSVLDPGAEKPRALFEGPRDDGVAALKKSIVAPGQIANELRKFTQFLIDHSELKAIGTHAIYLDDNGKDGGFGFMVTAEDCTQGQAISLVNCGDANIDEFIKKSGISVPGHGVAKDKIVAPTAEEVKKLG